MIILRRCRKCQWIKPWWCFYWHDGILSGYTHRCKSCRRNKKPHTFPSFLPPERFPLRRHAVHRYIQRVEPSYSFGQAKWEMRGLMASAPIEKKYPEWCVAEDRDWEPGFVKISDDMIFCLREYRRWHDGEIKKMIMVATVLVRNKSNDALRNPAQIPPYLHTTR